MAWQSVQRLLDDRLHGAGWGKSVHAATVLERAQDYLGVHLPADVRGLVRPYRWQRGVLTVLVRHPALVYTVQTLEAGLCDHLKQTARERPREVRIVIRSAIGSSEEAESR